MSRFPFPSLLLLILMPLGATPLSAEPPHKAVTDEKFMEFNRHMGRVLESGWAKAINELFYLENMPEDQLQEFNEKKVKVFTERYLDSKIVRVGVAEVPEKWEAHGEYGVYKYNTEPTAMITVQGRLPEEKENVYFSWSIELVVGKVEGEYRLIAFWQEKLGGEYDP